VQLKLIRAGRDDPGPPRFLVRAFRVRYTHGTLDPKSNAAPVTARLYSSPSAGRSGK